MYLPRLSQRRHVEDVGQLHFVARRLVHHRARAGDILPVLPVEVLPDEVEAVDLPVVLEEGGLQGREVEVAAGVAAYAFVSATCLGLGRKEGEASPMVK